MSTVDHVMLCNVDAPISSSFIYIHIRTDRQTDSQWGARHITCSTKVMGSYQN